MTFIQAIKRAFPWWLIALAFSFAWEAVLHDEPDFMTSWAIASGFLSGMTWVYWKDYEKK